MTQKLAARSCVPCRGGVPPLTEAERKSLHEQLNEGWAVIDGHHLEKDFAFDTYREAVEFTNRVAAIAEEQDHHPDILLAWGKVKVTVWTHKTDGLTENDFIFAAKTETACAAG